ncbi:DUF433 domain-containing protein [Salegentibacter sp. F14]
MSAAKTLSYEEARLGEGVFTSSDVATILKIHKNRARYLINQYLDNKFRNQQSFKYKIETEGGYSINFLGLIELFVFERLRTLNVSAKKVIKFHDYLAGVFGSPYPFAVTDFLVSGRDLYFKLDEDWVSGDEKLQIGLKDIVEFLGDKIEYDKGVASKYYPLGKDRTIVVDPEYRFGQPVLNSTNLMVENLYDLYLAENRDLNYVAELYDLTEQQMKDVIDFMAA